MDKHERVADEIVGYISGGDIGTGSISELAFAVLQLAAILRREYGAERNAALEEAARVVEGHFASCPCCDTMTLTHIDGCTFETDCPDTAEAWRKWPYCAAAIRALKEAEHGSE